MRQPRKWCNRCGRTRKLGHFQRNRSTKSGYQHYCRECQNAANSQAKITHRGAKVRLLGSARVWARQQGVPCTISIDDIDIPEHCPALGIRLKQGIEKCCDANPTLDRLIPEIGYVPGNVRVISYKANRCKGALAPQEVLQVALWCMMEVGHDPA